MAHNTGLDPMPSDGTKPGLAVRLPTSQERQVQEPLGRGSPAGKLMLVCDPTMPVDLS